MACAERGAGAGQRRPGRGLRGQQAGPGRASGAPGPRGEAGPGQRRSGPGRAGGAAAQLAGSGGRGGQSERTRPAAPPLQACAAAAHKSGTNSVYYGGSGWPSLPPPRPLHSQPRQQSPFPAAAGKGGKGRRSGGGRRQALYGGPRQCPGPGHRAHERSETRGSDRHFLPASPLYCKRPGSAARGAWRALLAKKQAQRSPSRRLEAAPRPARGSPGWKNIDIAMRGVCPGSSSGSRFPGGELQSSVPAAEPHTQGAAAARCCNRRASLAMWLHFVPLPPAPPPPPPLRAAAAPEPPAARSRSRGPPERLSGADEFERGRARSCAGILRRRRWRGAGGGPCARLSVRLQVRVCPHGARVPAALTHVLLTEQNPNYTPARRPRQPAAANPPPACSGGIIKPANPREDKGMIEKLGGEGSSRLSPRAGPLRPEGDVPRSPSRPPGAPPAAAAPPARRTRRGEARPQQPPLAAFVAPPAAAAGPGARAPSRGPAPGRAEAATGRARLALRAEGPCRAVTRSRGSALRDSGGHGPRWPPQWRFRWVKQPQLAALLVSRAGSCIAEEEARG
ncbi:translation initiation factor IF-2-like [Oenanthe melanoleuca]|uniref:translation initiation factor IF-2-like n=1 Tax=Oenanthe melanoleuca TaxID=2939378 RepID=UPI0024C1F025|nr:translation initiation factor IF-2-like [Oenanthe melanoleuca]